ncbi:RNA polymerase II transcription mediator complex protein [Nitzschia inconspicua]|uniref:RNA polymerase II transcription mediator complex protein n=1 Tax=Nitzschia inconspicua TaxID=303405 RepID=A0A9K3LZU4_9STRA|nr:RNA polymerase II transcription mediator complex protein [Nitzschia inconspicua]
MAVLTTQQLLAELQADNAFFDQLVDMIPSKLYIAGNSGDDYNPKYFKGQSKESKEARRAENKQAKRAKLDPSLSETTTQLKQRLETQERQQESERKKKGSFTGHVPRVPVTTVASVTPPKEQQDKNDVKNRNPDNNNKNKSRIEALREKLHAKLEEKRAQRPQSDPSSISKRAARRAEKKRRQEEAAQRKKKATSNAESDKSKRMKVATALSQTHDDPLADLAQVDYGLLSGLNPSSTSNYTEANKALRNLTKTKNLEKLLADAEAKKQRLEELKQSKDAQDKEKAANIEWGDALKEASGTRVKDDPAKLKKALKRKAVKKQKSAKAWKTRLEQTQQKMDERQKIRNHNLQKRKLGGSTGANLSKKRIATEETAAGRDTKTGTNNSRRLSRPGFEGRKQDFLNKKRTNSPNTGNNKKKHQ